jgi:uncharacterized protein (TIGR02246 family)
LSETISPQDRFAIQDLIGRYVWALDSGDVDGVAAVFTPDGRAIDTQGNRYEGEGAARRFAIEFTTRPDFRGRQHLVTPLFFEGEGDRYVVTSYWTVVKWRFALNTKEVAVTGWSKDTVVRTDAGWLIEERWLGWYNDRVSPWVGPV